MMLPLVPPPEPHHPNALEWMVYGLYAAPLVALSTIQAWTYYQDWSEERHAEKIRSALASGPFIEVDITTVVKGPQATLYGLPAAYVFGKQRTHFSLLLMDLNSAYDWVLPVEYCLKKRQIDKLIKNGESVVFFGNKYGSSVICSKMWFTNPDQATLMKFMV